MFDFCRVLIYGFMLIRIFYFLKLLSVLFVWIEKKKGENMERILIFFYIIEIWTILFYGMGKFNFLRSY